MAIIDRVLEHWILVGTLFVTLSVVITCLISNFVRKHFHSDELRQHHEIAGFVIATVGLLYAVFLGMTATSAREQHSKISTKVNQEAYLASDLIRFSQNLSEPSSSIIQQKVRAYLKSVTENQWKYFGTKKEDAETLKRFEAIWEPIYAYQVKGDQDKYWFSQVLNILSRFNSARLERVYTSWEPLGVLAWSILIIGAIALISILLFFGKENARAQIVLNSLFVGMLSFMLYCVFLLDRPFDAPNSITPKAFEVVYSNDPDKLT